MPIPSGDWKGNFNGVELPIRFNAPNAAGLITGTYLNLDFRGFWDEVGQTITFSVNVVFEGPGPVVALFRGYLFRTPQQAQPGRDVMACLAGHFEVTPTALAELAFVATGTARRNVFGWFAQVVEVN